MDIIKPQSKITKIHVDARYYNSILLLTNKGNCVTMDNQQICMSRSLLKIEFKIK